MLIFGRRCSIPLSRPDHLSIQLKDKQHKQQNLKEERTLASSFVQDAWDHTVNRPTYDLIKH